MDRSSGNKKGLILLLISVIILHASPNLSIAGGGGSHIELKDINVAELNSLTERYFPGLNLLGEVSWNGSVKVNNNGVEVEGEFSSPGISLYSEKLGFPVEFSNLEGKFSALFPGKGPQIRGSLNSKTLKWGEVTFEEVRLDYFLKEKKLTVVDGQTNFCAGRMDFGGEVDFSQAPPSFTYRLNTEGVDIQKVASQLGGEQTLSGLLFLTNSLSGSVGKPTTYSGNAKIRIEEGDLGKVILIGRVITFLPLAAIPGIFSFDTLEGDFEVSGGYARTENLKLKGPGVMVFGKGELGWNRKVDFILSFYISSELLKGTPITRMLGVVIDDFGNALRRVKVTGTIDKPEFVVAPLAIGDILTEGLKRAFGGLSQEDSSP